MPKHKHKHGMIMVIIGAKPKKKGETGVKKAGTVCAYCKEAKEDFISLTPYPMCNECAWMSHEERPKEGTHGTTVGGKQG